MPLSDQMGIHSLLNTDTLEFITYNKDNLYVDSGVKEHIVWYYFCKVEWSDQKLSEIIKIYKQDKYLALESRVVSAIKKDEVNENQVLQIQEVFDSKEIEKQIKKWNERRM